MKQVNTRNLFPRNQKWTREEEIFYVKAAIELKRKYPEKPMTVIAKGLGVTYGSLTRWLRMRGGVEAIRKGEI